ncbi:RsiW-degrading membrane proteinase PrsW (M82 family) [Salinibacterium sp. CAN_S4]|uniref:PrsW family intramembrane metalloprotease n=1 Tax=Salinibacterium sp. CAN_S4 TaxID=2787727 RepID=UPI001A2591E4
MSNPTQSTPDLTASSGRHAGEPASAPTGFAHDSVVPAQPASAPKPTNVTLVLGIVGVVVLSVLALGVAGYLVMGLGGDAVALGGVMALIPLAIVFFGVRWIDRWEREPRLAVLFAFLWGAAVAVIIALVVGDGVDPLITLISQGDEQVYQFIGAAIQAPLVEESAKGLGLLVIFIAARRYFDGPVDGIVYAAWVAGGFAFTENILYFGSQLLDAGTAFSPDVAFLFFVRGVMSPFAHVMFTMFIGLALGIAARRGSGIPATFGLFLIGLIPAMLLHALWNGALFFVNDFFGYYVIVQFPLFVLAIVLVRFLRKQEAKLTFDRLSEYAAVGWFAHDEIPALATAQGRRQALAWATRNGRRSAMKQYITDATKLAFTRQRIITGRGGIGAVADEAAMLADIVESRRKLAGSVTG